MLQEIKHFAVEEWESGAGGHVHGVGLKSQVIFEMVANLKSIVLRWFLPFLSGSTSVEWCLKNVSAKQRVQTWDDNDTAEK